MAYLSTTTPLAANGTITLGPTLTNLADRIVGSAFSDVAGTVYIEQSYDGTNWDVSSSYSVLAGDGTGFSEELIAPNVRVRYVNGAGAQTAFRLFAKFSSAGAR